MTRSSKLKVHRANSEMIKSYPGRFSTVVLFFTFFVFLFSIKNIYYYTHSTVQAGE